MIEGKDYELIMPESDEEYWACRILTGQFNETVIKFGAIALNEVQGELNFNFFVESSPDVEAVIENVDLQIVAQQILTSVIDTCLQEGLYDLRDRETGESVPYDEVFRDIDENIDNGTTG